MTSGLGELASGQLLGFCPHPPALRKALVASCPSGVPDWPAASVAASSDGRVGCHGLDGVDGLHRDALGDWGRSDLGLECSKTLEDVANLHGFKNAASTGGGGYLPPFLLQQSQMKDARCFV